MTKVHVICAPPNGVNPGMASVDLAFDSVARAAGLSDVTYWRLWDVSEWSEYRGDLPLEVQTSFTDPDNHLVYQSMRDRIDEAFDADLIVYWGDFLHMAAYQGQMQDVLHRRIGASTPAEAQAIVAKAMMLKGVDAATRERVLTYGTTLSMNTTADYAGGYGDDLASLMRDVRGAWMRDPYSAMVVRTLRGGRGDSHQGADAAFLLDHGDRDSSASTGGLGVFIGRSKISPETAAGFGRQLARELDLVPHWIPWGDQPAFWPVGSRVRFRAAWPALEHPSVSPPRGQLIRTSISALRGTEKPRVDHPRGFDLIRSLAEYQVIVTDTYHLAINAWAQGIPTICLVDQDNNGWNVNSGEPFNRRDKRIDVYSQLDALPLVVDIQGLRGRIPQEVTRVAAYLADSRLLAVTHSRVAQMRAQSMRSIVEALVEASTSAT